MTVAEDRILYEDDHLLGVNKRGGELVVKGKGKMGKKPLLDYLKPDFPGLLSLQRLDFETSGVVMFAKTKEAHNAILNKKFYQWMKTYHALVMGRILRPKGWLRFPLPARGKGVVPAETSYKVLDVFANSTYVSAQMETGRHHQIRRHFAKINHPLVLDREYGHGKYNQTFTQEFGYRRFFLHAAAVTFPHPITGKQVTVEAPLPDAFVECIERLRNL